MLLGAAWSEPFLQTCTSLLGRDPRNLQAPDARWTCTGPCITEVDSGRQEEEADPHPVGTSVPMSGRQHMLDVKERLERKR